MSRKIWLGATFCLCLMGGLLILFWQPSGNGTLVLSDPLNVLEPVTTGYVGSASCAGCHADLAESYQSHPMFRSARTVQTDQFTSGVQGEAWVPGHKRVLTAFADPAGVTHSERMYDQEQQLIFEQRFPMDYVVGSGQRARAYLRQQGHLLLMSPLNWYAAGKSWGLAPGYRPDDVRRFRRRVSEDCLACHSGRPAVKVHGSNTFEPSVFHEISIGCERCHGPGEQHVRHHEQSGAAQSVPDSIVNPAKLSADRRDAVCYQCHLSAAARILRPGRGHTGFRPGMSLSDVWLILDSGAQLTEDGETKLANHVQQMHESVCWQKSDHRMRCTSCHDPHRVSSPESAAGDYRAKCLKCHETSDCSDRPEHRSAKNDHCAECHMVRRKTMSTAHAAQTDHRILKHADQPQPTVDVTAEITLRFWGDSDRDVPPAERNRAVALGTLMYLSQKGQTPPAELAEFFQEVLSDFPDDPVVLENAGGIAARQGKVLLAKSYYEKALRNTKSPEVALSGLVRLHYGLGNWASVVQYCESLLEIDPGDLQAFAMQGDALARLGRSEAAIQSIRSAVQLDPGLPQLHEWLVEEFRRQGRSSEAAEEEILVNRVRGAKAVDQRPEDRSEPEEKSGLRNSRLPSTAIH
ncbi:MAG: tetratricopeptide repeat protein [Planctomycetaceae bacterium]